MVRRTSASVICCLASFVLAGASQALADHCTPCNGINGSIDPGCDWQTISGQTGDDGTLDDAYSFNAVGGATYIFSMCQQGGTANYDAGLSVWDSTCSGSFLTCIDDFCGLSPEITWVAPTTGTYVIKVGGFFSETGSYTLAYRSECEVTLGTPEPLDSCYQTLQAAQDAACAAALAVAGDTCDQELGCRTFSIFPPGQCGIGIFPTVFDDCDHEARIEGGLGTTVDSAAPFPLCNLTDGPVTLTATECEAEITFGALIGDDCCLDAEAVEVTATAISGAATIEPESECTIQQISELVVDVLCTFEVSNITECPVIVKVEVTATDCCGNTVSCMETVEVRDETPPVITNCPEPITLERGDKLCNSDVQDWLDTFTATDNCPAARVYDADDLDLAIPPSGAPLAHTITVPDSFLIEDLNIDLAIEHTAIGNLQIVLSHGGVEILIRSTTPCLADNYNDIILDDEGGSRLIDQCQDNLSSPPNYVPVTSLAFFDGLDAQGDWTITIYDFPSPADVGTLDEWSLHFNGGPTLSNDASPCGFPPGTTEVTFTATDTCGNMATCTSEITIEPFDRIDISKKGSFLAFSKIEALWEDDGSQRVLKDSFLTITNDYPGNVLVQGYFINGDIGRDEERDENGDVIQEFEPGWNTADCVFELTGNQTHTWSAINGSDKCQPFVILDPDGRPANSRILRGYAVFWAVKIRRTPTAAVGYDEIRWNHLTGDALIVDYMKGTAEEYNAWAAAVTDCVAHGEAPRDCICHDHNGTCCQAEVVPGRLDFDGFQYDISFDQLLLDFYGSGSTALSGDNVSVMVETRLSLHTLDADLRQDGNGPVLTKVEAEIWNEFESKFSGTRRCMCCWDSTLLSDWSRSEAIPNHFTRNALRTDKGKARLDGVHSNECVYEDICGRDPRFVDDPVIECPFNNDHPNGNHLNGNFSRDASLLGTATKMLSFTGRSTTEHAASAINLTGMGEEAATIRTVVMESPEELQTGRSMNNQNGSNDRQSRDKGPSR